MRSVGLLVALRRPVTARISWHSRSCYSSQALVSDSFHSTQTVKKETDRLRILFCGSDDFSCASLLRLYKEQQNNANIASIDVVVRPPKPRGRGNKIISKGPLHLLAEDLKLDVHQRDSFTGWNMPQPEGHPINLIIAVSFGLFVPPRLLRAAKYGGLNVHPSLLPDLRGPAPIQHAILLGRPRTGTTLQTLSEETFDGGIVLGQKALRITPDDTFSTLHERLKDVSGTLLIHGIRNKLYVPPLLPQCWTPTPQERAHLAHAPKITTENRRISWDPPNNTAAYIARQNRALGPLWTTMPNLKKPGQTIRVLLDNIIQEPPVSKPRHHEVHGELCARQMAFGPEEAALWVSPGEDESAVRIGVPTSNQSVEFIRVGKIKVEGGVWNPAWHAFSPYWHLD